MEVLVGDINVELCHRVSVVCSSVTFLQQVLWWRHIYSFFFFLLWMPVIGEWQRAKLQLAVVNHSYHTGRCSLCKALAERQFHSLLLLSLPGSHESLVIYVTLGDHYRTCVFPPAGLSWL